MNEAAGRAPIRILVVDDSSAARELLVYLLNADPKLQVIGTAADGEQAVVAAQRLRPDVITMDIHLPKLDGFGATRIIMETCPTRIVMVTATSLPYEVAATFNALEAGALTVLGKPLGPGHPNHRAAADELLQTVKLMAEVQVVKRWMRAAAPAGSGLAPQAARKNAFAARREADGATDIQLVAIGASTGGPLVLQAILSQLTPPFAVPVLIVQHIAAGFTDGFAEWLARTSGFRVKVATHREYVRAGTAYIAPDGTQMVMSSDGTIALTADPPEYGLRPSVSCLFRSIASVFGPQSIGILLTGMGRDGAQELKLMRQAGAVTIAQDKESAVIYGMPGEAVKLEAATYVLPPEGIATTLNRLVNRRTV